MTGIFLKLPRGGGEGIRHSNVRPPQGSPGAFSPLKRARMRLLKMMIRPVTRIHYPIVDTTFSGRNCGG
jgi:hypothetical protein